ncbi:MAG TPA: hypothetical protein VFY10_09660, partial [Dehalococcoidia bacterium]|nr:hypothetical protein [Dehalococcoidia bacterium]
MGSDYGEFQNPHNVIVDEDEYVYVADRENNRVQVFDGKGHFEACWNQVFKADGMCTDADGIFYVGELVGMHDTNAIGHRTTILSKFGRRLARIGSKTQG